MIEYKRKIVDECCLQLNRQIEVIKRQLVHYKDAVFAETKSSVGDKYETTRAMMQAEIEKSKQQLAKAENTFVIFNQINFENVTNEVEVGSLVVTDNAIFLIAVAMGKVKFENESVFVISPVSPMGKKLLGKKVGDVVIVNSKNYLVKSIS